MEGSEIVDDKAMQARENLKKLLRENPNIAKAFRETLDEMRQPENIEKMARDISKGIEALKAIQMKASKGLQIK